MTATNMCSTFCGFSSSPPAMPQALAEWVRDQKPDSLTEATVWADEHAYNKEYGREGNQVEKWKFRRGDREASTSWEAKPRDDKSDSPGRSNH